MSNKPVIDLKIEEEGGGLRISLHFLRDEEGTLYGCLGSNKTNTGSQMWKICHVTGANIQKDVSTVLFYIYALSRLVFAASGTIKRRHVRAAYRPAAVGTSLIIDVGVKITFKRRSVCR